MALKGQLNDFNLAEILQLIATQQKTGFLVLEGRHEMVFVFERGVLVSTRDRRSAAPDPLEAFLRNYGFFTESQWEHVGYIRRNSSLDLAEILVSEELLNEEQLSGVLRNVAFEMAHRGMKMRRGRYNFTATRETPPGVRSRVALDVQGLLMEAARRVDEETELARLLPSPNVTFVQGPTPPPPDVLSPNGRRIIKLALGGRPLGKIIRLARIDSFTTREMLKNFLDEGWLQAVQPEADLDLQDAAGAAGRSRPSLGDLRKPLVCMLTALLVLGFGAFRWAPLALGEMARIGLAAPAADPALAGDTALAVSWLDAGQEAARQLRLRQIQAEVGDAAGHYRADHGAYPARLQELVDDGLLDPGTCDTVDRLGWQYARTDQGKSYRLDL
jgi:hypothetical protein